MVFGAWAWQNTVMFLLNNNMSISPCVLKRPVIHDRSFFNLDATLQIACHESVLNW